MTQDEIIRMAREAGIVRMTSPSGMEIGEWWGVEMSDIERFAALVAAHEREACAKVCDEMVYLNKKLWDASRPEHCAAAIRERSNANARARSEK